MKVQYDGEEINLQKQENTRHVLGARRSTPWSQGWAAVGIPGETQDSKVGCRPSVGGFL